MSNMHSPPHPGETLRDDVLPALGLTVTDAATQLGVTRAALSRVLNGKAAERASGWRCSRLATYGLPSAPRRQC
jgi:plasmid maintenance system antidote protein VapI